MRQRTRRRAHILVRRHALQALTTSPRMVWAPAVLLATTKSPAQAYWKGELKYQAASRTNKGDVLGTCIHMGQLTNASATTLRGWRGIAEDTHPPRHNGAPRGMDHLYNDKSTSTPASNLRAEARRCAPPTDLGALSKAGRKALRGRRLRHRCHRPKSLRAAAHGPSPAEPQCKCRPTESKARIEPLKRWSTRPICNPRFHWPTRLTRASIHDTCVGRCKGAVASST